MWIKKVCRYVEAVCGESECYCFLCACDVVLQCACSSCSYKKQIRAVFFSSFLQSHSQIHCIFSTGFTSNRFSCWIQGSSSPYYLLICSFLSLRAPSSEINGGISVQFYLLVITLIIPARYLFMILMPTQASHVSLPGTPVGIKSSDLCIHCKSGYHLQLLSNCMSMRTVVAWDWFVCFEGYRGKGGGSFPVRSKRNLVS